MAVLEIARQKGLKIGLVDHIFQDRDRITPDTIKSSCRKKFSDIHFLHGCEVDAFSPGKVALTEPQRVKMDFVITQALFQSSDKRLSLAGADMT